MARRHVIFGCNGPVGVELMERLAATGDEVVGVCRSGRSEAPAGTRIEAADVRDVEAAKRLAQGASVVYCCIGIPYETWPDLWPGIIEGLLAATEAAGARLVFADNLYCYGPQDRPLEKDMPLTDYGRKPALRASLARTMLEAHRQGRAPVVLVRASDFYGPRVTNAELGETVFPRLLAGKAAQLLGRIDVPHTFAYVPDFARALVTLASADDDAFGRAWHVPSAPAVTQREVIERIGTLIGTRPKIQRLPGFGVGLLGLFNPLMRELHELIFQWQRPYLVDHSRFAQRFWGDFTPLDEGLAATVEWYRRRDA